MEVESIKDGPVALKENLPAFSERVVRGSDLVSATLEKAGSFIIIIMVLIVTTEIIGRNVFHVSTVIAGDVLGLLLGCMTFLGFAESLRSKTHVRVDFLTYHFSEKGKRIANIVASFLALIYALVLFIYTLKLAVNSFQLNATSQTSVPMLLWPFQIVVPLGIFSFILVLLCYGIGEMKTLRGSK
ncbi:MAG: hypothetical protein C3F14_04865 [Deltaproteobacteria bacterium]|nr:MAG: hypothetical protein C3F14_04865 [Deltaproteobacteria bacterium]